MANTKKGGKVVDRWDAVAITNVSKNTPAQQKVADEWNAKHGGKTKKPATKKKK